MTIFYGIKGSNILNIFVILATQKNRKSRKDEFTRKRGLHQ